MVLNDKEEELLFDDVKCKDDLHYRFCVKLWYKYDSISILSSNIVYKK